MARPSPRRRRLPAGAPFQGPKPVRGVLRIDRPANDNFRPHSTAVRIVLYALAATILAVAAVNWLS